MGAQSEGATRRAARLADGVFFGPQVAWRDVARLAGVFARRAAQDGPGRRARRRLAQPDRRRRARRPARAAARAYLERTFAMYRAWEMQEPTMVRARSSSFDGQPRRLDDQRLARATAWRRSRARQRDGARRIGFTIYSLPREVEARIDYLQMIAEEIVRPAARARPREPCSGRSTLHRPDDRRRGLRAPGHASARRRQPYAGGTELLLLMKRACSARATSSTSSASAVSATSGGAAPGPGANPVTALGAPHRRARLTIGATVTHRTVERSGTVARALPAGELGGPSRRQRARAERRHGRRQPGVRRSAQRPRHAVPDARRHGRARLAARAGASCRSPTSSAAPRRPPARPTRC